MDLKCDKEMEMDVFMAPDCGSDFPLLISRHHKTDLTLMLMKSGYLHAYDHHNEICVGTRRISQNPQFFAIKSNLHDFLSISRDGIVSQIDIDESSLGEYFIDVIKSQEVAILYAKLFGIQCDSSILENEFQKLILSEKYAEASNLYAPNNFSKKWHHSDNIALDEKLRRFYLEYSKSNKLNIEETMFVIKDLDFCLKNEDIISRRIKCGMVCFGIFHF